MNTHSVSDILIATSGTFSTPILQLPSRLQEAVTSAYLCARAADDIEDHPTLDPSIKVELLQQLSAWLQAPSGSPAFRPLVHDHIDLPEVTLRIEEWVAFAPSDIAPRVLDTVSTMADRMAYWVQRRWTIRTDTDLDRYTFATAGVFGLLLSDLWAWHDGTVSDRADAVAAGKALQGLNMLLDRDEDLARGVDFLPDGWNLASLMNYTVQNLERARGYVGSLPDGPAKTFCTGPFMLAWASIDALKQGEKRLSRAEATDILAKVAVSNLPPAEH